MSMDWQSAPASPRSFTVKRILRLEIPDVVICLERKTAHVLISSLSMDFSSTLLGGFLGSGEEKLRGRPGYEHLNEPLHILVEADLSPNIIDIKRRQAKNILEELLKPVDESQDFYKRQQLRELAMLNSNFREDSPGPSGSVSPFNTSGMKRAKTGC
ncbi:hypothetical protein Ancab_031355 [Ancistrocladus abbreviatus]